TPLAATRTRIWPAPGMGTGTSSMESGFPNWWTTAALIVLVMRLLVGIGRPLERVRESLLRLLPHADRARPAVGDVDEIADTDPLQVRSLARREGLRFALRSGERDRAAHHVQRRDRGRDRQRALDRSARRFARPWIAQGFACTQAGGTLVRGLHLPSYGLRVRDDDVVADARTL